MYHKLLTNFQITRSPNPRTATKQKERFERSVRRVLTTENIKPGATSSVSTKLAAAKKCGFLFLPSQKIMRRVHHLRYKNVHSRPTQKDYQFPIPQYYRVDKKCVALNTNNLSCIIDKSEVSTVADYDVTIHSVPNYNPIPNMFIPVKYRDIIPPDLIYDDSGSFIIPGSREWFSFMYQLDLKTRDERVAIAEDARMAKIYANLEAESKASDLRIQLIQEEHRNKLDAIHNAEEKRLNADALYHGTSPKHVDFRQRSSSMITRWNDTFHNSMSTPQQCPVPPKRKGNKKKKQILKTEMDSFLINYPNVLIPEHERRFNTRPVVMINGKPIPLHPYTSDETKDLETRPLKRVDTQLGNLRSPRSISKRSRLDTTLASDSEQAGPSNSKI
ncbi:hypothetical protein RhiirA4_424636 [Rhizophagus irregularis]|uniref:DUF8211 domain-containing protein n=1 Tax=Rhizophagus irregularis TaxID=588596 RepID=A0A2I1GY87_9GLOM|nr:hypothetical protein RhiirA4_424636 [Rhizophagus irregularis]